MNDSAPGIAQIPPNNPADESVVRLGSGMLQKDLIVLYLFGGLVLFVLGLLVLYFRIIQQSDFVWNEAWTIRSWMLPIQAVFTIVSFGVITANYVRFLELTPQAIRQYKLFRTVEISLDEVDRCVLSPQNNRWEWTLVIHSKSGAELSGPLPIRRAKDRKKVLAFLLELESRGLKLENLVKFRRALIENKWGSVPEWDQRFQEALGAVIFRCPHELSLWEQFWQIEITRVSMLPLLFALATIALLSLWPIGAFGICALVLLWIASRIMTRPSNPSREFVIGESGIGFFRGETLMEAYAFADLKSLKFVLPRYNTSPTVIIQMNLQTGTEFTIEVFPTVEVDQEVLKAATEKVKSLQAGGSA